MDDGKLFKILRKRSYQNKRQKMEFKTIALVRMEDGLWSGETGCKGVERFSHLF